jgi:hypothetical protein
MKRLALTLLLLGSWLLSASALPMLGGYTQTAYNINVQDFCASTQMSGSSDATSCLQAAIDSAYNNGIETVYCPAGAHLVTSSPIYQDPPGNLRSSISNPTIFQFSLAFVGLGGANSAGSSAQGCVISPNFNNGVAWWIGPGQGNRLVGVNIVGPTGSGASNYRCGQNSSGVGVAVAGGSGGATRTDIENVWVSNFYSAFTVGQNANALADSTTFRKDAFNNACNGIYIPGTQAFITSLYDVVGSATTAVNANVGTNVYVYGGNLSAGTAQGAAFTISSVGSVTAISNGNNNDYSFQATISSPDGYVNTVYNSYAIVTTHFGIIPLVLTSYNSGTGIGTFRTYSSGSKDAWGPFYYGGQNALSVSSLGTDIGNVTTLYAAERLTVFEGTNIAVQGGHLENPQAPTTLAFAYVGVGGNNTDDIGDMYFDYDPSLSGYAPANSPTNQQLAWYYIQQAFPFVEIDNGNIRLHDIDFDAAGPLNVDWDTSAASTYSFAAERLTGTVGFNQRVVTSSGGAYPYGNATQINTSMLGGGVWDRSYNPSAGATFADSYRTQGFGESPQWGFRPASWSRPCLTPALITTLTGSLPSISPTSVSYPLLWGGQQYQVCDWEVPSQSHYNLVSNHYFYSYGQNLTTSVIPSLSWSAIGQGEWVYVNDTRMFFPGLGIQLNTSANNDYIVTGVVPGVCNGTNTGTYCGYLTVAGAYSGAGSGNNKVIAGTSGTNYTGTTIGQDSYSITQY